MTKRQTQLTHAQRGAPFHKPVGTPVPPNEGDRRALGLPLEAAEGRSIVRSAVPGFMAQIEVIGHERYQSGADVAVLKLDDLHAPIAPRPVMQDPCINTVDELHAGIDLAPGRYGSCDDGETCGCHWGESSRHWIHRCVDCPAWKREQPPAPDLSAEAAEKMMREVRAAERTAVIQPYRRGNPHNVPPGYEVPGYSFPHETFEKVAAETRVSIDKAFAALVDALAPMHDVFERFVEAICEAAGEEPALRFCMSGSLQVAQSSDQMMSQGRPRLRNVFVPDGFELVEFDDPVTGPFDVVRPRREGAGVVRFSPSTPRVAARVTGDRVHDFAAARAIVRPAPRLTCKSTTDV